MEFLPLYRKLAARWKIHFCILRVLKSRETQFLHISVCVSLSHLLWNNGLQFYPSVGSKRIWKGISKKHNEKLYEGLDVTLINTSTYAEVRIKETRTRVWSFFMDFNRLSMHLMHLTNKCWLASENLEAFIMNINVVFLSCRMLFHLTGPVPCHLRRRGITWHAEF